MSARKPILLYFYPAQSSFVVKDLALMQKEYEVRHQGFLPVKKWQTPLVWLGQLFFLLRHIWQAQALVCMFAGYHSWFPALFGKIAAKPCLIVAGGTDCVSFPSIGYGVFANPVLGRFARWSYQLAAHIAPVHEKLVWQDYTYQTNDFPHQGFRYHCPTLVTPHTVIYNGYNAEFWKQDFTIERQPNSFLTVCAGLNMRFTQRLKGVDLILEVAGRVPEATFTIVGAPEGFKFPNQPANVRLLPKMPLEDLKAVYSAHTFYLQLSMSEGFPNALSESMLCGCVPIVSQVGAMPDLIADTGFVLSQRNIHLLERLVREAMEVENTQKLGQKAREIMASHYPEQRRERGLIGLLQKLVG
ncbi:glycosyltransferase family 1 protein [Rufibacter immobilis]|uniref:Glycosyltransferase family 1 protein n=1 Tax=Rufibacter immobilis TaxID=1348778 RepID=A0A3M9MT30_9BACT|nr:glycosyltransferase family 4 protein [Rufibacter immobilis]RNI28053.1 glycosyltransferase family 1 protein [Rufibacter immobilis]